MSASSTTAAGRVTPVRRGGARSKRLGNEWLWALLLIAPTGIGLAVFTIWPAIQTFWFSFTEWGSFGGHEWIGVQNYVDVLQDPRFGQSLLNTFIYTAIALLGVPISMGLAALLNRRGLRGLTVYRTIYYLPVITLPAAVALVWGGCSTTATTASSTGCSHSSGSTGPAGSRTRRPRSTRSGSSPSGGRSATTWCCSWPGCSRSPGTTTRPRSSTVPDASASSSRSPRRC